VKKRLKVLFRAYFLLHRVNGEESFQSLTK